jgi:hypothetical protein
MPALLYVVEYCWNGPLGLSLNPGIPMKDVSNRPELKDMIQGMKLELRLPDGTRRQTTLATYGVSAYKQPDGSLLVDGDPSIRLIIPGDIYPAEIPAGTEIWLIE